jgi:5-formyltetrahydrofolate cyclo-ligase
MSEQRQHLLAARKNLTLQQREQANHLIQHHIINSDIFKRSQHIACYWPLSHEVATAQIIESILTQQKQCYLPVVQTNKKLNFVPYTADTQLQANQHSILEPSSTENYLAENLDLVIVPLVGFDQHAHRLGWGQGHYDRSFEFMQATPRPKGPYLLGLGYQCQYSSDLVQNTWDVRLDAVVSEVGSYPTGIDQRI